MSVIDWPLGRWFDCVAQGALSSKETLRASYDMARVAIERNVPGDFVECGVFGGAQCAAMARAILDSHVIGSGRALAQGVQRRVHLFDSFAGVPASTERDTEWIKAQHPEGISACTLENCQIHMREWGIPDELLVWHPGMFADTLPQARLKQIAVLRLDGDLYESTRVCLERLHPLLSVGGWLIVDDWGLSGPRVALDEHIERGAYAPAYFPKQP